MQLRHDHNVLFISNGHGEDLIGERLAKSLQKYPGLNIKALPIVGVGTAYTSSGIPLLMEGYNLPSGGFIRNGLGNLWMDLKKGLFGLTWHQIKSLKRARAHMDLAVCVGDVYLLILAGYFLKRPIVFLPTAKSDYVAPHWNIEVKLMRRFCAGIFPRDQVTADSLAGKGLPARFLGNIMMDSLDYGGHDLESAGNCWNIAILPGSRLEAYLNMEDIAPAALAFQKLVQSSPQKRGVDFLVALANGLSFTDLLKNLEPQGWKGIQPSMEESGRGKAGYLDYPGEGFTTRLTILQNRFADVLAACDGVIGMAGTANEQAVGLGKPVVTFIGRGPQFTAKFVQTQQKLLGEAVSVVQRDPEVVAQELYRILTDKTVYDKKARTGRERMGGPGGSELIAGEIVNIINAL